MVLRESHTGVMNSTQDTNTAVIFAEARGWLEDCGFDTDELAELDDLEVRRVLDRNFDGGWVEFLGNCGLPCSSDRARGRPLGAERLTHVPGSLILVSRSRHGRAEVHDLA